MRDFDASNRSRKECMHEYRYPILEAIATALRPSVDQIYFDQQVMAGEWTQDPDVRRRRLELLTARISKRIFDDRRFLSGNRYPQETTNKIMKNYVL